MVKKKVRLKKDGTPWGRTGRKAQKKLVIVEAKPVSRIQEIIDSGQAPGVHIAEHHKATWKHGMPDPDTPLDWSTRTQRGADWGKDRLENHRGYRNPEL